MVELSFISTMSYDFNSFYRALKGLTLTATFTLIFETEVIL